MGTTFETQDYGGGAHVVGGDDNDEEKCNNDDIDGTEGGNDGDSSWE